MRAGIISEDDLPKNCIDILGKSTTKRINCLVTDMIVTSDSVLSSGAEPDIKMSDEKWKAMNDLRTYMFKNVYFNPIVKKGEDLDKIKVIINTLYDRFLRQPEDLSPEYRDMVSEYGIEEMVKDQIAGMTDRYAVECYEKIK
jgi:dGTPase